MLTAQIGGDPGPSGPWASTLSETAKRRRRPSTIMELGTIRMVGLLRILRSYWSRTTPEAVRGAAGVDQLDGGGPVGGGDDGAGDLQRVIRRGRRLDLKNRTAMRHSSPALDLARRSTLPADDPALQVHGIRPRPRSATIARATGPCGLRRWVPCTQTSSFGGEPWWTAPAPPASRADVAITGGRISDDRRRPRRATACSMRPARS